jgi:hypothetical protein
MWRTILTILLVGVAIGGTAVRTVADTQECRAAIESFDSARSDIADAIKSYADCVAGSDGHDDCSSEFETLKSAQDDLESAVSEYEGNCS